MKELIVKIRMTYSSNILGKNYFLHPLLFFYEETWKYDEILCNLDNDLSFLLLTIETRSGFHQQPVHKHLQSHEVHN